MHKPTFTKILLLSLLTLALTAHYAYGDSEELIIELNTTEVYPSEGVAVTIYYLTIFPETKEYEFHEDPIPMTLTTSGLLEDIETSDFLLEPLVGSPIQSGTMYRASELNFTVPDEAGEYGSKEVTYQVYLKNLEDYCNKVTLKVLKIDEKISLELKKPTIKPGEETAFSIKYTLLTPDLLIKRPLNQIQLETELPEAYFSTGKIFMISFPGTVESGQEITVATGSIKIPSDAEPESYIIKAAGKQPMLTSNQVSLEVVHSDSKTLSVQCSANRETYNPEKNRLLVVCQVTDGDNQPVPEAVVELSITDPSGDTKSGSKTTKSDGRYSWQASWKEGVPTGEYIIQVKASKDGYKNGASNIVKILVEDPKPELFVDWDTRGNWRPGDRYKVTGTVTKQSTGEIVQGATVEIYLIGFGEENLLAKVTTDSDGKFLYKSRWDENIRESVYMMRVKASKGEETSRSSQRNAAVSYGIYGPGQDTPLNNVWRMYIKAGAKVDQKLEPVIDLATSVGNKLSKIQRKVGDAIGKVIIFFSPY